jgi:flagellar motility protein MotE (MotC chaperone)
MRALSQEKMAEVLAKMDPGTAAKMVEALSQGGATGTAGFE